jgi:hypothetical protein
VIVSQTVRSAKPAKAIYEVTLAKLREQLGEDLQASEVRYFLISFSFLCIIIEEISDYLFIN